MLEQWKTRDILVVVTISIALAVITFAGAWVRTSLEAALGVFGHRLVSPLIILIVYAAGYVVRRPGSALLSSVVMGLVASPFLPAGLATVFGYMIGGVLAELSYAVGRYRAYNLTFMMACGVIYNLIGIGLIWVPFQLGALSTGVVVGVFAITILAGLVGGWLTKALGDGILNSGVMTSYLDSVEV